MLLSELLQRYYALKPALDGVYKAHLKRSAKFFGEWLGHQPTLADFNDENLVGFMQHLHEQCKSTSTINNNRSNLVILWRFAWKKRHMDTLPRDVPRWKGPRRLPDAWTLDELQRLLDASQKMRECFRLWPMRKSDFYEAFIHTGYETALRRGDLCRLTMADLDNGFMLISKTQEERVVRVTSETRQRIERIADPERPRIFWPWPTNNTEQYYLDWRRLLSLAGFPPHYRSGVQKLRRTSASHLERVAPGTASWHLGHRTPDMAAKHYLDPRICRPQNTAELLPRIG